MMAAHIETKQSGQGIIQANINPSDALAVASERSARKTVTIAEHNQRGAIRAPKASKNQRPISCWHSFERLGTA